MVGPEAPLAAGLADELLSEGIACFGPSAKASEIEWSKEFSKNFMLRHNIPTARFETFTSAEDAKKFINSER